MIAEIAIAKPSLRNQVVRRRRGRPRNEDRRKAGGTVPITFELTEAEAIGLGLIATRSNIGARESEFTLRAQLAPYLLDLARAHLAERFPDVAGASLAEFFRRLCSERASGVEPEHAMARVLVNLRPAGGVM